MSTILVADTPHSASLLIPVIAERHPDAGPVITVASNRISSRGDAFRFPGPMSFDNFPATRSVEHEPFLIDWGFASRRGASPISNEEVLKEIQQADNVYLFAQGDKRPALLYHATLFVTGLTRDAHVRVIEEQALSPNAVRFAVRSAAPVGEYRSVFEAVAAEEYFEFNYRLNSFPLVSKLHARHGGRWRLRISASGLQFLLWLRKSEQKKAGHSFSREDLSAKLSLWTGSGKFSCVDSVGRRIGLGSRHYDENPLDELINSDLLFENKRHYEISDVGRAIADEFPSICYDPDQPFRIEAWKKLGFDQAKIEIDSYLTAFFKDHAKMSRADAGEFVNVTSEKGA